MWTGNPDNVGEFQEREYGKWFTYRPTSNPWAVAHDLPFEVDVLDGVRYAKVLKTVAHIAVDESDEGVPVIEVWSLKKHNHYVR